MTSSCHDIATKGNRKSHPFCAELMKIELQIFLNFSAAHSPVRLDIETKFSYFLFLIWLSKIRNQEFRLYI